MIILYTEKECGHWKPWNVSASLGAHDMIRNRVRDCAVYHNEPQARCHLIKSWDHFCTLGDRPGHWRYFVPRNDELPIFHSILLDDNSRWDALNRKWQQFVYDESWRIWWNEYITNFDPSLTDEERDMEDRNWWRDHSTYRTFGYGSNGVI